MNIGEKIDQLMREKGMNAKELSEQIGVTPSTIYSLIQRGSSRIDVNLLIKIANALGTTADELITGERKQAISNVCPLINQCHSSTAYQIVESLLQLDDHDQTLIQGEVRGLLLSEKYSRKERSGTE